MMNLNQAIAYGNQMGVKFYVRRPVSRHRP